MYIGLYMFPLDFQFKTNPMSDLLENACFIRRKVGLPLAIHPAIGIFRSPTSDKGDPPLWKPPFKYLPSGY